MRKVFFLGTKCDFYKDEDNNIYMTREQIGEALQYSNPRVSLSNIHNRNKDRLDNFSVVSKLIATDNKHYNTTLYIERGIYDICRFSRQPLADQFYDWVYDKLETIRKTKGYIHLGEEAEFLDNYFNMLSPDVRLSVVKDLHRVNKEQQEKIEKDRVKVENWESYMDAKGNMTIAKVAKTLNIENQGILNTDYAEDFLTDLFYGSTLDYWILVQEDVDLELMGKIKDVGIDIVVL